MRSVISTGYTHPRVDPSWAVAPHLMRAPSVATASIHQGVEIALPATKSTKEEQRAKSALKDKSLMLTAPSVLIQSHAMPLWTAAVMVPQLTLTSLTDVFAAALVATLDLTAARHLLVTQLSIAVVMAPRLTWTAPMAVHAPVMMAMKGQTAQLQQACRRPFLRWESALSLTKPPCSRLQTGILVGTL